MGIIDNFFTNHDLIIKGFNAIKGDVKYIVAKDRGGNILCLTYDIDTCNAIIEKYLKDHGISINDVKIMSMTINKRDKDVGNILDKKIVILDDELVLYDDVKKKSNKYEIEDFRQGSLPNYGINKYITTKLK